MFRIAIAGALLLTAGATTATTQDRPSRADAKLARALDGLTPGAPVSCIPRYRVSEVRTYPDALLYVQGRDRVWRNNGCQGLRSDDLPIFKTPSGGQYCKGDIVETRSRIGGMVTGACALGEFVPYARAGAK